MMRFSRITMLLVSWLVTCIPTLTAADEPAMLETLEVIGITPLHGMELRRDKVPANVQTVNSEDIEKTHSLDVTDFMQRRLGSVTVNAAQNNPLQPDVQYRGFTASPVLGLPQGIAVYQNGVRVNEVFGDTVNWDLIPIAAIASMNLISGSNPLFGQNTLGGALSLRTKTGFTHPGYSVEASGGAFDRVTTSAEAGGSAHNLGYYVHVSYLNESGWRPFSPSNALNVFGTIGWHTAKTTLDVHVSHAQTKLTGNGPTPVQLLERDRAALFTHPDITRNHMQMVNLEGTHWLNDKVQLSGHVYYRQNTTDSFNGDGTSFEECADDDTVLCHANLQPGMQIDDVVRDQNNAVANSDFDAVNNISRRRQYSYGGALQTTVLYNLFGRENQFLWGFSYNQGRSRFTSDVELARILANRGTSRSGLFVPLENNQVYGRTATWSLYITDTYSITDKLALTLSGRFNFTRVSLDDKTGRHPGLNGQHDYERFNLGGGVTYQLLPELKLYGGYFESSRAPTIVELACADKDIPCTLPNAFLADPPLQQVVAGTFEGGVRGTITHVSPWDVHGKIQWQVGVFHTVNRDDILFLSTGGVTSNRGYFDNVGQTRRRGIELSFSGEHGKRVDWFLNYTYLQATFEDAFFASSPHHPLANANGEIFVKKGSAIPGLPRNTLKLGVDVAVTPKLRLGGNLMWNAGQYLRGDEGNLLEKTEAYTLVNLHGEYRFNQYITAFARINNVFDSDYETFGLLGEPGEVLGARFTDPRFLGAGAPLSGWFGVKVSTQRPL